ncbi:alpha/beta hydrolase [Shouchella clausii]|uniref:alpha/beta hydrolase n=1 Tax=Shouchella clausii TaxID=79880 RepID=UPI0026F96687|nr:alpha/beta hydrolase [Shouchella clausii]MDO7268165.1 alpha/beta hydrolase [Shouchella clausii]MDO7288045.1 alpha/beta hydrolase [Shouchella clausii]
MAEHKHIFQQAKNSAAPTLVLLHGTGGNERDLLPIAEMIDGHASVLGVRGNVSENGMPRFFKRLAEGVFDKDDLQKRTGELYTFLDQAAAVYGFNRNDVIVIGYSNGANIAANLMYEYSNPFKGAMLFHAMVPQEKEALPSLEKTAVFLGAGKRDPLIPAPLTEQLRADLQTAGAATDVYWTEGGHELAIEEIHAAKTWYNRMFPE